MTDWKYNQRYNSNGEWNPRLISCEDCNSYQEPEHFLETNHKGEL